MPAQNIASYFMFPIRVFVHILFINSSGNNDLSNIKNKYWSLDYSAFISIPSYSDFNDYTLEGNYCGTDNASETASNGPASGHAFSLKVWQSTGSGNYNYVSQLYFDFTGQIYLRVRISGNWNDWNKII